MSIKINMKNLVAQKIIDLKVIMSRSEDATRRVELLEKINKLYQWWRRL